MWWPLYRFSYYYIWLSIVLPVWLVIKGGNTGVNIYWTKLQVVEYGRKLIIKKLTINGHLVQSIRFVINFDHIDCIFRICNFEKNWGWIIIELGTTNLCIPSQIWYKSLFCTINWQRQPQLHVFVLYLVLQSISWHLLDPLIKNVTKGVQLYRKVRVKLWEGAVYGLLHIEFKLACLCVFQSLLDTTQCFFSTPSHNLEWE